MYGMYVWHAYIYAQPYSKHCEKRGYPKRFLRFDKKLNLENIKIDKSLFLKLRVESSLGYALVLLYPL